MGSLARAGHGRCPRGEPARLRLGPPTPTHLLRRTAARRAFHAPRRTPAGRQCPVRRGLGPGGLLPGTGAGQPRARQPRSSCVRPGLAGRLGTGPLRGSPQLSETELILAVLLLGVAALYSSVGHAGASGYIAMMALMGLAPEQIRPTALTLNLLVGGIGLFRFWRNGHVRWRNVLPFVLASAPAAFFAAQIQLPKESYSFLLGVVLLVAAIGVFRHASQAEEEDAATAGRRVPWLPGLATGAGIGVLSGLTGTGGAIFLTPLLLFARWMPTREASGTSVAFVWINSLTALAGLLHATGSLPTALPLWLGAVAIGALIGTQMGLHWLPLKGLRRALGVVLLIAAAKLFFA
ncbi:sulfite exporter TauE/SafE family protein [Lysobacter aestuarii]|uniref:Probable membrane transporter protein n=1 Tax=Marilutibacter aestuarii TaxID=1706195 RepID=A0A508AXW9_9GAMM|nr:sulfite exporter TauE/SafE family protein [Lysobacter aestuarii]